MNPFGGGGVPIIDGFIFPPLFGAVSLWFARAARHDTWAWWQYGLVWVGLSILAFVVHSLVYMAGSRKKPSQSDQIEDRG